MDLTQVLKTLDNIKTKAFHRKVVQLTYLLCYTHRYEDICIQPVEYAEKIYRFAGLRMTNSMMKLIAKYTKVSSKFGLSYCA